MADISKIKLNNNEIYDIKDEKARENIAPTFSTSESYNIGAVVLYNGTLYKCIVPHTAGAWNSEHFEETTITAQINSSEENTTYSLSGTTASDVTTITLTGSDSTTSTASVDVSGKEDKSNKVTSISSSSTDTQYPSAKCVYDIVGDIESILEELDIRKRGVVYEYSK